MITVDRATFEALLAKFEITTEHEIDVEYSYDTFSDAEGEMLGLISYHAHHGDSFSLHGDAEQRARDLLGLPQSADLGGKIYTIEAING
ncbi:hypothetical protein C7441_114125 [Pseudaminobacter salicylatoxidans]|uniref:Uncharacterized protein n=1 Tax=Pseudaminobacter salicylatoxidans TaxID=93369 RepID=A0A316BYX3_PSESE|nr:hypothetical protein [Pseudaminobacter salicylatoxidans]PWJ79847.1 hypothetical protein C7441_114125 [Pseudaminobacter salicylatoxidans]